MSFYDGGEKAWYLPFGHITNDSQLKLTSEVVQALKEKFYKTSLLIGHNLVFDMQVLRKQGIYPEEVQWFDTIVAQHLINENGTKSLKKLSAQYFGTKMSTFDEVAVDEQIAYTSLEKAKQYACEDAIQTWNLYKLLAPQILQQGLYNLFKKIEMPFLRCVIDLEWNGVLIDKEKLFQLEKETETKLKTLQSEITQLLPNKYKQTSLLGGVIPLINLGSSQQLTTLLYKDFKLPIKMRSKNTGLPSVGTPALQKIKQTHPIVPLLIKYKEGCKLISSFLKPLPTYISADGRIHCRFNDTGTHTGRLSSDSPNLQQLPKKDDGGVRSCFIAKPEHSLLVLDYSQEELRFAAFITGDESMTRAYKEGLDLHLLTANKIFNLKLSEKQLKSGTAEYKEAKEKYHNERDRAKTTVFGILYGTTEHSLSDRLNIPLADAKSMIDNYFKSFPKIKQAVDATHQSVRSCGFVRNYFGRYRHFVKENGSYPSGAFRQSFNHKIQGSCSDLLRVSMNNIRKFLKKQNDEAKLLFTVHDEICVEVPENKTKFYLDEIKKIMEQALIMNPPLVAEGKFGNNYAEAK